MIVRMPTLTFWVKKQTLKVLTQTVSLRQVVLTSIKEIKSSAKANNPVSENDKEIQ
jgi:hypothetical protein